VKLVQIWRPPPRAGRGRGLWRPSGHRRQHLRTWPFSGRPSAVAPGRRKVGPAGGHACEP